jgi:hypothetical protein
MTDSLSSSNRPKFSGQFSDIRADASLYTHEDAASLYVAHPEGLPGLERNSLIVGPIGSGKTIMLKALYAEWSNSKTLRPIYVDVLRWTSQVAGETETYDSERLSPRGRIILDAMSLAIILGICESSGVFQQPNIYKSLWPVFGPSFGTQDPAGIRESAQKSIREALIAGKALPPYLPSVFAVATTLGSCVRSEQSKTLVLLVDQIDQVSSLFFEPIASLLRRSSEYVSVLATRPCATAPEAEVFPSDVTSGDSYRTIQLGRSLEGIIPHSFVLNFIKALPLQPPFKSEIEERAELIANVMWPSLRFAVSTIHEFVRLRASGRTADQAWYQSVKEIARNYEDLVQDGLRAWCSNPKTMLKDWRRRVINKRGGSPAPIGRANLQFQRRGLFGDIGGKAAQHLIRVALKKGVLLMGPEEHYVPGVIPPVCEIAPLLLVNDPDVELATFDPGVVTIEITHETLERWSKSFGGIPKRTSKRIFVSYWMSDPQRFGESPLAQIVQARFGNSIDVVTGALTGSPRWSPEIIEKISKVDLVLCDLSVARRDIFFEYGVAIGKHIPVIQCVSSSLRDAEFPSWVANRQNQYFALDEAANERLATSVSAVLENVPDPKSLWKRDSLGRNLEAQADIRTILVLGPVQFQGTVDRIAALARERGFASRFEHVISTVDNLENCIRLVRSVGTIILAFDATANDYLTCVAGGLFTTKKTGYVGGRTRYDLEFLTIDLSSNPSGSALPALLASHPKRVYCADSNELVDKLTARLGHLQSVITKASVVKK